MTEQEQVEAAKQEMLELIEERLQDILNSEKELIELLRKIKIQQYKSWVQGCLLVIMALIFQLSLFASDYRSNHKLNYVILICLIISVVFLILSLYKAIKAKWELKKSNN